MLRRVYKRVERERIIASYLVIQTTVSLYYTIRMNSKTYREDKYVQKFM